MRDVRGCGIRRSIERAVYRYAAGGVLRDADSGVLRDALLSVLHDALHRASQQLGGLDDRAVDEQPMVSVLREELAGGRGRARAGLEGREKQMHPRARERVGRRALDTVARDLAAASRARRAAERREQQAQVIAYLGDRADGRACVLDGVLLAERERGRNLRNRIDVRPVHPLQEHPGVGRQALDIAPLTLGVERVEDQAGFARARHSRHHDQLVMRQVERDTFKIVGTRPADTDGALYAAQCVSLVLWTKLGADWRQPVPI